LDFELLNADDSSARAHILDNQMSHPLEPNSNPVEINRETQRRRCGSCLACVRRLLAVTILLSKYQRRTPYQSPIVHAVTAAVQGYADFVIDGAVVILHLAFQQFKELFTNLDHTMKIDYRCQ
jgi:hypothetical protein